MSMRIMRTVWTALCVETTIGTIIWHVINAACASTAWMNITVRAAVPARKMSLSAAAATSPALVVQLTSVISAGIAVKSAPCSVRAAVSVKAVPRESVRNAMRSAFSANRKQAAETATDAVNAPKSARTAAMAVIFAPWSAQNAVDAVSAAKKSVCNAWKCARTVPMATSAPNALAALTARRYVENADSVRTVMKDSIWITCCAANAPRRKPVPTAAAQMV